MISSNSLGTNDLKAVSTKATKAKGEGEYVISGVEKMKRRRPSGFFAYDDFSPISCLYRDFIEIVLCD